MTNEALLRDLNRYFNGQGVFEGLGVNNLRKNYNWPKRGDFPDISGVATARFELGSDNYENNILLKENSKIIWQQFGGAKLANWIISEWGGIRGNKKSTLQKYIDRIQAGDVPLELKGVASYSKILSFVNPEKYAIYDARVAISLNAIQLLSKQKYGLAFRYLPGRNTALKRFREHPRTAYQALIDSGWRSMQPDDTYTTYLELLRTALENLTSSNLYHLEMSLFADAENLARLFLNEDLRAGGGKVPTTLDNHGKVG